VVELYGTLIIDGRTQIGYYHPGVRPHAVRSMSAAAISAITSGENNCRVRTSNRCGSQGVHSDVGGSHSAESSRLSQIALDWMLCEAVFGLVVDPDRASHVLGYVPPPPPYPPHAKQPINNSPTWAGRILEFLPSSTTTRSRKKNGGDNSPGPGTHHPRRLGSAPDRDQHT